MQEKMLNEKESLELISRMIRSTQQRMAKGRGNKMLLWGYATVLSAVAVAVALYLSHDPRYYMLYLLIPVIGYAGKYLLDGKSRREQYVSTYIDRTIRSVWIVFGGVALAVGLGSFFALYPVLALITLLIGMGVTITGLILRMKLMVVLGIVAMLGTVPLLLVTGYGQNIVFAAIFVIMLVIPGHIVNYKGRKHV